MQEKVFHKAKTKRIQDLKRTKESANAKKFKYDATQNPTEMNDDLVATNENRRSNTRNILEWERDPPTPPQQEWWGRRSPRRKSRNRYAWNKRWTFS